MRTHGRVLEPDRVLGTHRVMGHGSAIPRHPPIVSRRQCLSLVATHPPKVILTTYRPTTRTFELPRRLTDSVGRVRRVCRPRESVRSTRRRTRIPVLRSASPRRCAGPDLLGRHALPARVRHERGRSRGGAGTNPAGPAGSVRGSRAGTGAGRRGEQCSRCRPLLPALRAARRPRRPAPGRLKGACPGRRSPAGRHAARRAGEDTRRRRRLR
jgi:hypothetical protein